MPSSRLLLVFVLAALASTVWAHSVWIEPAGDRRLVVRFGEPGEKNETSPGYLDSLAHPVAWTLPVAPDAKPAPIAVEKNSDHFLLLAAEPASSALGETAFPVMKRSDKPAGRPHFYVRWHPAGHRPPAAPALTLDLVPTATPGEFRVFLRGRPLPAAVVAVEHLGGGSGANLTADAAGLVRYTTEKPGLVLMTCNHKETLPGFAAGAAYDVTSHNNGPHLAPA